MATIGLEQLVESLFKIKLVQKSKVEAIKEQLGEEYNVKKLLYHLVEQKQITKWQARRLFVGETQLKIGDYTLVNEAGENALGPKFSVESEKLKGDSVDKAVLQKLPSAITSDKVLLKATIGRLKSLSEMTHPGLLKVHDCLRQGDEFFVVMEDSDKYKNLADQIKADGALEKYESARIVKNVAQVIEALHISDTKHTQISPGSILVSEDQVKLAPFDEVSIDDPSYFYETNGKEPTFQDDLHSLGRTGVFLLTAKRPSYQKLEEVKSPLVTILRKMMDESPKQIDSATTVEDMIDIWLESKQPSEKSKTKSAESVAEKLDEPETIEDGGNVLGINLGPSRLETELAKRKSSSLRPKEAAKPKIENSGEAKEESEEENEAKSSIAIPILIGAAVLGLLLFASVAGAGWYFLFGPGKQVQVAATSGGGQESKADEKSEIADPETDGDNQSANDESDDKNKEDEAEGNDKSKIKSGLVSSPIASKNEKDKGADKSKTGDDKAKPPEDLTPFGKKGGDPKNDSKDKKPPKPPGPAIANKKKKATPPPKVENVFAQVPAFLKLPALGTPKEPAPNFSKEVSLAKLKLLPADVQLFSMAMYGGEFAMRGPTKLSLKEKAGDIGERLFQVKLDTGKKGTAPFEIAQFRIAQNDLFFKWTERAKGNAASISLVNCCIALQTGRDQKVLQLREPVVISAANLGEKNFSGKTDVKIDNLPNPSRVRIRPLNVREGFEHVKVMGGKNGELALDGKDFIGVVYGLTSQEYFLLKIENRARARVFLTLSTRMLLSGGQELPFKTKKYAQDGLKQIQERLAEIKQNIAAISKLPDAEKKRAVGITQNLNTSRFREEGNLKRVTSLVANADKFKNRDIRFRVYYQAGDYVVDLATPTGKVISNSPPKPINPAPKKKGTKKK